MATYGEMQSTILDEMANDGALTTTHVQNAIQRAIKHYERRPWWFNEKVASFSTVAAQEYYSSADLADIPNIVTIYSATATVDGLKTKLPPVTFQDIDETQDGSVTGAPISYSVFKEQLRVYPIPDAAYTITLSYVYRLTALSADADTNAWTTEVEEMIRQSAKKRLALDILQADDLAARFATLEAQAFDEVMAENRRRRPMKLLSIPPMLTPQTFNITRGS